MRSAPLTTLEFRLCAAGVALLVVVRSLGFMLWEIAFDSDQAIVGLMAKHLSEFRAFPLFFYGQNYMLGVQSWIAVPFFWVGGPTIAMLRLPLLMINVGVAVVLLAMFTRLGARPLFAFAAVLPFAVTTPVISDALLETLGASVEPFAYVLLLWALRRRPLWFGAVFCIGYLHREFVVFVLPALAVALWRAGERWTRGGLLRAAGAFAGVWVVIDVLKRTVNAYGPPGGEHRAAPLFLQPQQILSWLSLDPEPYFARLRWVIVRALPDILGGGRTYQLWPEYGVPGMLHVGSAIAGLVLVAALVVCAARLAPRLWTRAAPRGETFTLYLGLVGVQTILAYGLNAGIHPTGAPIMRYLMLVLLVPAAVLGAFFIREHRRPVQAVVAALVCVWAGFNLSDNLRLVREYAAAPGPSAHRQIADYLTTHGMQYGRAGYWDSYHVTFLSREQVILASTGKVRVSAYQALVDRHASNAIHLTRAPCAPHAIVIGPWCVDDPRRH